MGSRDRIRGGFGKCRLKRTGLGEVVERRPLVEARHFDCIFDRRARPIDMQRAIVVSRDRHHALIDLRCERPVDPDLVVAGGFALLQRRIVQEGKTDGALDLERAGAFQEDGRRMGVDAVHGRMHVRVSEKGEHALLRAQVLVRRGTSHGLDAPCLQMSEFIALFP